MLPSTSSTKGSDKKDIIQHTMTSMRYLQAHIELRPPPPSGKGIKMRLCPHPCQRPFLQIMPLHSVHRPALLRLIQVVIVLCAQHGGF